MTDRFERECRIEVSAGDALAWHGRPGAFVRLAPPWERIQVLEDPGGVEEGSRMVLRIRKAGLWWHWVARHGAVPGGLGFTDEQVEGPFTRWVHRHRFEPDGPHRCLLRDQIEYALPLGGLGQALGSRATQRALKRLFEHRHARTRNDLLRHQRFAQSGPLRVAVSGASGLVGSTLCAFLHGGGHEVLRLVRSRRPGPGEVYWNPSSGEIEAEKLEALHAFVHLAGENIAAGRWTQARKRAILESRESGTRFLCERLAALQRPPKVLVSASAVGFYGNLPQGEATEQAPPGEGFLPQVCRAWEEATGPARASGIRVVSLRIGVVLAAEGGALARMLPAYKAGLGGRVGSGRQSLSWIALDDLVGAIQFCLFTEGLSGPVNATAPSPVTSSEFAEILGRILRRPALVPLPGSVCRLLFGEMGQSILLDGARVLPSRLQTAGFEFLHQDLESALRAELGVYKA